MKRTARDVAKAVGRSIRCARELRDARQIDVAKATGISASMLSLIEAGKRMPTPALCLRLAEHLRCKYTIRFRPREDEDDGIEDDGWVTSREIKQGRSPKAAVAEVCPGCGHRDCNGECQDDSLGGDFTQL